MQDRQAEYGMRRQYREEKKMERRDPCREYEKETEGNRQGRENSEMGGWRRRTRDRKKGGMMDGRNEIERDGVVQLNVSMDFSLLTEYLVMSCLSEG